MAGKHSLNSKEEYFFETNYDSRNDSFEKEKNKDLDDKVTLQENNTYEELEENQNNDLDFNKNMSSDYFKEFDYSKFKEEDFDDQYYADESRRKKAIICICGIIAVLIGAFVIYLAFGRKNQSIATNTINTAVENKLIASYHGYNVLGKIKIEKIDVEQYILDSVNDEALKNGVGKLYGTTLNSYGNFCIAGHNYSNIFGKLSELEVGDKFIIIDKNLKETEYKITQKFSSEPEDLKALVQDEEKIEITLITCENSSTTRLIIKAEEVNNTEGSESNSNTTNTIENTVDDSKENV